MSLGREVKWKENKKRKEGMRKHEIMKGRRDKEMGEEGREGKCAQ